MDIIKITVDESHYLRCPVDTIARDGEGNVIKLEITFPEKLSSYWVYLDFKMSNGETFKSPRLDVEGNTATYIVPPYVLCEGKLKMQVLFQNADGAIWKSYKKPFTVRPSINAVDEIPEKEDFITEAQKLLDEIASGGGITVDDALSDTSTNPVQNKVVKKECDELRRLITNAGQEAWAANQNAQSATKTATDAASLADRAYNIAVNTGHAIGTLDTRVTNIDTRVTDLESKGVLVVAWDRRDGSQASKTATDIYEHVQKGGTVLLQTIDELLPMALCSKNYAQFGCWVPDYEGHNTIVIDTDGIVVEKEFYPLTDVLLESDAGWTKKQQKNARNNIGAASASDVTALSAELEELRTLVNSLIG